MCGIFAYAGTKKIGQKIVFQGLKDLEYRGYDSWGIAALSKDGAWQLLKQTGKIGQASISSLPDSGFAFGHTRWATHGGVTVANAHPHADCSSRLMVVHNGIVENYRQLKTDLESQGHIFVSDTDTEVIVHLIEKSLKTTDLISAAIQAFKQLTGQSAVIVADPVTQTFVAYKQGSPLVIGFGSEANYFASDPNALVTHTENAYFLQDGEMAILSRDRVAVKTLATGKPIAQKPIKLTDTITLSDKGALSHYMLSEIMSQPGCVQYVIDHHRAVDPLVADLAALPGATLIGCGSAYYAAFLGRQFFGDIAKKSIDALVATEATSRLSLLVPPHLLVALSQSGETMDIIETINLAKTQKLRVAALVNVVGSSLYRLADYTVPLGCGQERAVGSTKAFITKLAYLLLAAYKLGGDEKAGLNRLQAIKQELENFLATPIDENYEHMLALLQRQEHLFVVGRGTSYSAGLEIALKLKEIAYLHAEAYLGSEIKHGPIALIEPGSVCLVLVPPDQYVKDNLSTASELKARGGIIIGLSPQKYPEFDIHLAVPDLAYETVFGSIVAGQMLSYHLAVAKGLDPDMPRNLAKSVTVK